MELDRVMNPIEDNLDILPQHLYKYRPFDEIGYGVSLAVRGEAYFSSAKALNDLFECHFIPVSKLENLKGAELNQFLELKTKQHFPDADQTTFQEMVELAKKRSALIKANNPSIYNDVIQVQYKNVGILSLTEEYSSMPMWAHYAAYHSGLCVGLRTKFIALHQTELCRSSRLMMLHRINYRSEIPTTSVDIGINGMTEEQRQEMVDTFCTKPLDWQYEKELRLIFMGHVGRSYTFGTDAVGEVIVGARASEANVEALLNELRLHESTAVVKQAHRSNLTYGLSFEEIKL